MNTVTEKLSNGNEINYTIVNGTAYHVETAAEIVSVLEALRHNKKQVRIFLGSVKTGEVWPEENDVSGSIGRSTGNIKIPLLVGKGEIGGGALLDHCIVGIKSGLVWHYKHPQFNVGAWQVVDRTGTPYNTVPGLPFEVMHNNGVHARFRTAKEANSFVKFMSGESDKAPIHIMTLMEACEYMLDTLEEQLTEDAKENTDIIKAINALKLSMKN